VAANCLLGGGAMHEDRRRFLKAVTTASAAGAVPAVLVPAAARSQPATGAPHSAAPCADPAASTQSFVCLAPQEVAFVEAAIARLIPADELGPGALEAGVAQYIDGQLASAWGSMARGYRQGPWAEGTPQQGYQSPLAPLEVYRTAIREIDRLCKDRYGQSFADLGGSRQDEVLRALEDGNFALEAVPATLFFGMLWENTQEGFFADPIYGGNRDKVGWRLVGFPGVAAVYLQAIEQYDVPYRVHPVSIADLQRGSVPVDAHGHPVHAKDTSGGKG
jgi:gluconate 2-dehydrogenase gamma chain